MVAQWEAATGSFDTQIYDAIDALRAVTIFDLQHAGTLATASDILRRSPTGRETFLRERADRIAESERDELDDES